MTSDLTNRGAGPCLASGAIVFAPSRRQAHGGRAGWLRRGTGPRHLHPFPAPPRSLGSCVRAIQHSPAAGSHRLARLDSRRVRSHRGDQSSVSLQRFASLGHERSHRDQDRHDAGDARTTAGAGR
jgi:hypothetical protein